MSVADPSISCNCHFLPERPPRTNVATTCGILSP
jgi:hypothetical protein